MAAEIIQATNMNNETVFIRVRYITHLVPYGDDYTVVHFVGDKAHTLKGRVEDVAALVFGGLLEGRGD